MRKIQYSILPILVFCSSLLYGQTIIKATHVTDDQKSVDIIFSSKPGASPDKASFTVTANGVPMTIVAVSPIPSPTYRITFSSALPIDPDPVIVTYSVDGSSITSINNRAISCSDFEWATNTRPTPSCAPVDPINKMVFSIKPGARNSSQFDLSKIESRIYWNDPSATISNISPYESDEAGFAIVSSNYITFDSGTDNFSYPESDDACAYTSEWKIFIDDVGDCLPTNPNQIITYTSHNTDNEGDGKLRINTTKNDVLNVCINQEAEVKFIDSSTLNCLGSPTQPNNEGRWVRIIYGDPTAPPSERIPNVYLNGIQVTDDKGNLVDPEGAGDLHLTAMGIIHTGGDSDVFGVAHHPAPIDGPIGQFLPISTKSSTEGFANRNVGDKFKVRLEYWNICNPYDNIGNITGNEVAQTSAITIVDLPEKPMPVHTSICLDEHIDNFSIQKPNGVTKIKWYDSDPGKGGKVIENPFGKNSANLPTAGIVDNTKEGVYSVWVTVFTKNSRCESEPARVDIKVRSLLTVPVTIIGPTEICNGTTVSFEVSEDEGENRYGGEWEYIWQSPDHSGMTFKNSTGKKLMVDFNLESIPETKTSRTIQVMKRYKDSPSCVGDFQTVELTIYQNSVGGTISQDKTICEGESTGELRIGGNIGKIVKWQRKFNDNSYEDIAHTAGLSAINEILNTTGAYLYRAVVANGICDVAYSETVSIIVNKIPTKPTINISSGSNSICEGEGSIVLHAENSDVDAERFIWYNAKDLKNPIQDGISDQLELTAASESGNYVVRVVSKTSCESEFSEPKSIKINPIASASVSGGGSVCAGNPAPDIIWEFLGAAPYSFRITVTGQEDIVVTNYNSDIYTIAAPNPSVTTHYEMVSLTDGNNCSTGSLGGIASVAIGGTPPVLENNSPYTEPAVCNDGSSTTMPAVIIDLDKQGTYRLTFNIDGGKNEAITFTTDQEGKYVIKNDFNTSPFNSSSGSYYYNLIAISNMATGCQTLLEKALEVEVLERPEAPKNPKDAIICSGSNSGGHLTVDNPGEGNSVIWFSTFSDSKNNTPVTPETGIVSGTNNNIFVPNSTTSSTFYAAIIDNFSGCISDSAVEVRQIVDETPFSNADIDGNEANNITCGDVFILNADAPGANQKGTWSGPHGIVFQDINDPGTMVGNLPEGKTTLRWTINSEYKICENVFDEITIERFPLPVISNPDIALCADEEGPIVKAENIDLNDYNTYVNNESSERFKVEWFIDAARTKAVVNAESFNFSKLKTTLYTRVTNIFSGCSNDGEATFSIAKKPDAFDATVALCEDVLGIKTVTGVDITSYNDYVSGPSKEHKVAWYTDATYSVAVPNPSSVDVQDGKIFYALVSDVSTAANCTSEAILTFKINSKPTDNPIQGPSAQCQGSSIQLYQIFPSLNAGTTYSWDVPEAFTLFGGGGPTDFFVLLNFPTDTIAELKVTEVSENGCIGNTQTLSINVAASPPALNISPTNAELCANESGVKFGVDNLPNTTYSWSVPAGATIIKGQGTNEIEVNFGLFGGNVSVVPTSSSANCAGESARTTVLINPLPQMNPISDKVICSEEMTGITFSYLASGEPAQGYDILNIALSPGLVANEGNIKEGENQPSDAISQDHFVNLTNRKLTVTYTVVPRSSSGCTGESQNIILTIDPQPFIKPIHEDICSGEATGVIFDISNGSIAIESYTILAVNDHGLIADSTNATFSMAFPYENVPANFVQNDVFRNYTSLPVEVRFDVVPATRGCTGEIETITLTVFPEPEGIDRTLEAVCSGETISLAPKDYIKNAIESGFYWTAFYDQGIKGGAYSGSGNIDEILINTTDTIKLVKYEIKPTSILTGCEGEMFHIMLPVYPKMQISNQVLDLCASETVIDLKSLEGGFTDQHEVKVAWFTDEMKTNKILNPEQFDAGGISSVFAEVSNDKCNATARVNFNFTEISISSDGVISDYNGYNLSCHGEDDATIKFTANGSVSPYRYSLLQDSANISGIHTGEFTNLGAGSYSAVAIDKNGCSSNISIPITVNNPLPLTPGTIYGEPNICEDSPELFIKEIHKPLGGIGNYKFQWEASVDGKHFYPAHSITAKNPDYTAVSEDFSEGPGIYYFRRKVTSGISGECAEKTSNIVEVRVNPKPAGDFTFKNMDGHVIEEICAGEPFLVEFTFTGKSSHYIFDYADDKGNVYNNINGSSSAPILVNFEQVNSTTIFTLMKVRDMYGCESSENFNVSHAIKVPEANSNFKILGEKEACSPASFQFQYDQISGVTYTWKWFDGSPDSTYTANETVKDKIISRSFNNGSSVTAINYEVVLNSSTTSSGQVCESNTQRTVTLFPKVKPNIFTNTPMICSGEDITFSNLTQGADSHKWFYRIKSGENQENQVQTTESATFNIVNSGKRNPEIFEIVYTGFAQDKHEKSCAASQVIEVEVYKAAQPEFTYSPELPEYLNGHSLVQFFNTSSPANDSSSFSYNWNFDDGLIKRNSPDPGVINYTTPGEKEVTLTIINKAKPGMCDATITKSVYIGIIPLKADLAIDQKQVCQGDEITIANISEGDVSEMVWEIFDENNLLIHRQIDKTAPQELKNKGFFSFKAPKAGKYTVTLSVNNTYTGSSSTITKKDAFEVYALPIAHFDTSPDHIYIPDQPLMLHNLSDDANTFEWDFGDGSEPSSEFEPLHNYLYEGNYVVTLTAVANYANNFSCSDIFSKTITAEAGGDIKVPNAFTPSPYGPSGDGRIVSEEANDIFLPVTKGVVDFSMVIYNRWGEMIFQSNDTEIGWDGYDKDGKLLPAGVYIYQLTIKLSNGQRRQMAGDVTLIK